MWNAKLDEAQVEIKITKRKNYHNIVISLQLKFKKRLPEEIPVTSDMQITPP